MTITYSATTGRRVVKCMLRDMYCEVNKLADEHHGCLLEEMPDGFKPVSDLIVPRLI